MLSLLLILVGCTPPPRLDSATLVAAARHAAGGDPARVRVDRQAIVVEHPGHGTEAMPLYVARGGPRGAVMLDQTGARYAADIDDFRATNHLLSAGDTVLVPEPFTGPSDRAVTWVARSGHTGAPLWVWRLAGALVLAALGRPRRG